MSSSYIRIQDRRRNLAAALSTACLYALAFFGALLIGSLTPAHLASVPGTVIVDLGDFDGPAGAVPQGLANAPDRPLGAPPGAAPLPGGASEAAPAPAPEPAPAVPSKVAAIPAPASAPKAVPKAAVPAPKAAAAPAPKPAAKTAAKAAPSTAKTIPEKDAAAAKEAEALASAAAAKAAAAQAAVEAAAAAAYAAEKAAPPKTRTFGSGSGSSSTPVSSGGSGSGPGIAGGTGTVTFRGSEMGNALATTFGASQGQVGRNIYVPIYLYMPLPAKIGDSIYRNIERKATFGSFYQQSGSDWQLKAPVPLAQRGELWTMLEAAGFDASTADFKAANKLSPVVLEFAVGPLSRSKVELVDVRLVSSSGSSEIDEAVIYGFRQASFFNKTGNAIAGKFVYGF